MSSTAVQGPDVFDAREIARAAGVSPGQVRRLIAAGHARASGGRYLGTADAVRAVRLLRSGMGSRPAEIFRAASEPARPGAGFAASGALHVLMVGCLAWLATLGATAPRAETASPVRLVFLARPGPGGGGGGGGLRQPSPPARAELKGSAALRSPVPPPVARPARAARVQPPPRPKPDALRPVSEAPPATPPPAMPEVAAPVATAAADAANTAGVVETRQAASDAHGQGSGGGAGTGAGPGLGEGSGPGIGPGSGGGTGGGPYRPGTGISPPAVQREVKPDYTDAARRRGLSGDVVLEIVVRSDGSVGDVRLLQGLGAGLDERAIDAVRQWRFYPARRYGVPVDVLVEIAVEFKLR